MLAVAVMWCLAALSAAAQQAAVRVEYFVGKDPGAGMATTVAATPDADGNVSFSIPDEILAEGSNLVGLRALHQTDTVCHYSPTLLYYVFKPVGGATLSRAEYFWDTDPGFGLGTPIDIEPGDEASLTTAISTAGLSTGAHVLGIRTTGAAGWSPTLLFQVFVPTESSAVSRVEYFWDDDPGFGQGTPLDISALHDGDLASAVPTSGLAPGDHTLGLRSYGGMGWSPTVTQTVYVPAENTKITRVEYFWNDDPGFGLGTPIDIEEGGEVTLTDIEVPSDMVHGDCTLHLRSYGAAGWSPTVSFTVMVDAEGNYTLDNTKETDMDTRNFNCMADLLADFAGRGVGGDVSVAVKNTRTAYPLDLTAEGAMTQFEAVAANLAERGCTVAFAAPEGSCDTICVTTAESGLAAVVAFFACTSMENVTLTVNGDVCDFSTLGLRRDETCSGGETVGVELSDIGHGISAAWTAQPHDGTTIAGYETAGTGDLPAMTLTNSGTRTDSLQYAITLTSAEGDELYAYTYNIYVHPLMAGRTFAGMQPLTGSSLTPGGNTLRWNAMDGVRGYLLRLSWLPTGDDGTETEAETDSIYTGDTQYVLDVKEGYTYTWTVTAVGHCDSLTSEQLMLSGRLLPDLTVETVTAPEGAEAENAVTVKARVGNAGKGATTEGRWTDRLYYTIDSGDFATAVLAGSLTHNGNLQPGEGYDVEFSLKVPPQESGVMRFYVVADATEAVAEADDGNNRTESGDVQLKPFYMNADDLAALRKLYADFGGSSWTGEPWDVASELIKTGNWSGVTFDTEGRVTAVNLQGRGLTGTLSETTAPVLPALASLNLSRNALDGDLGVFADSCPALTTLNVAYNQIDDMSKPLPATITSLDISWQHRKYGNNYEWPGLDRLERQTVTIGGGVTFDRVKIATYNHAGRSFTANATFDVFSPAYKRYGTLAYSAATGGYVFTAASTPLVMEQDAEVILEPTAASAVHNSAYPARLRFISGDANISGWVDVNDVQRTLNYVLGTDSRATLNLSAADTYDDGGESTVINVQDIVCTVNIVLDNESAALRLSRAKARQAGRAAAPNVFGTEGRMVVLESSDEIAAFDMEIEGVTASQIRLLLDSRDFSMMTRETDSGVRVVVFSLTGRTIAAGRTEIMRLSADGRLTAVQCTSAGAEDVDAAVADFAGTTATGIPEAGDGMGVDIADGCLLVSAASPHGRTLVTVYGVSGPTVLRTELPRLEAGVTRIGSGIPTGGCIYVVRLECPDERMKRTYKIKTR